MPETRKRGGKNKRGGSKAKKLILFKRGAEAAQRVGGYEGLYFCPICAIGYNVSAVDAGDLTLEHVPQDSIGGRGIALTCKQCNSTAGHTVDAAVHQRDQVEAFARMILMGEGNGLHYGRLRIGGEVANVQVTREQSGQAVIELRPGNNNPEVLKRIGRHMKDVGGLGGELKVTARQRYHLRHAQVGELRSAFLAVFAMLGYRFAFHPHLERVRQQIMRPDEKIIANWTMAVTKSPPRQLIALMPEPEAFFVQIGTRAVLLPAPPHGPADLYEQLVAIYKQDELVNFTGARVGWPTHLEMRLDLEETQADQDA
ncbi:MAG TPA: HNH endonuclease [Longimicrobium sp.]|jgi:hypothetical protein|uniref:HNH endonuclease n=1 Tax=Longimicrobium sp. TaxID=2029185 RepID=UPI002ED84A72